MEDVKILAIIKRIRESFDDSVEVYTSGSCVKFCMILKEMLPTGNILYNSDHAIFEYKNKYYDILGYAHKTNHILIEEYGLLHAYDIMSLKYNKKL